ncbi:MAG: polyprenyl synthetase family protein [Bacteroidota bacterium]
MKSLNELQTIILGAVNELQYPTQPPDLYEPISYILSLGGKRLRPALLLMACDVFGGDVNKAIKAALAIEVFHNFTLMHDDIMDKAPLRRGQITVHERWNPNVAILAGDAMMVEANKLMLQVDDNILRKVMDIFNTTATGVCEGQQFDMSFESRDKVSAGEYINMIRLKTAILLGGALKIGALIGGASEKDADLLYTFGEQLGIAFQLQDDILDVYGDPDKFGKQVGGDIIANKKTFLLIKAQELADEKQATELQQWLDDTQTASQAKVAAITGIYNNLQIREQAERAMQTYASNAFTALDSINLPDMHKQYLRGFADSLLVREY